MLFHCMTTSRLLFTVPHYFYIFPPILQRILTIVRTAYSHHHLTSPNLTSPHISSRTRQTQHRDGTDIFSVNALHFHAFNTFASAGSDGVITYWDKDARHKLTSFELFKRQCPVTDVKFNPMVRTASVVVLN